jgi:hypothetical protein
MVQISQPLVIIGGGQSGLAAARAAQLQGLDPLVLEARERPTGSWTDYYDSLRLFSPARFSAMPDAPFPGDPDHYPSRDEVSEYLARYADRLGVEVRTSTQVTSVHAQAGGGFRVETAAGDAIETAGLVAATGSFNNPYRPLLPGQDRFPARILHAADYSSPEPFAGQRVVVVGGGNSAVQIAYDLAEVATTTIASRHCSSWISGPTAATSTIGSPPASTTCPWSGSLRCSPPPWSSIPGSTARLWRQGCWTGVRGSPPSMPRQLCGRTGRVSGSTPSSSPPATARTWTISSRSAPSKTGPEAHRWHLHHPPRARLHGPRIAALLRLEHAARGEPRRAAHHGSTGRTRPWCVRGRRVRSLFGGAGVRRAARPGS